MEGAFKEEKVERGGEEEYYTGTYDFFNGYGCFGGDEVSDACGHAEEDAAEDGMPSVRPEILKGGGVEGVIEDGGP